MDASDRTAPMLHISLRALDGGRTRHPLKKTPHTGASERTKK
jgi:hypothetical protein